jgi:hypothetical protein
LLVMVTFFGISFLKSPRWNLVIWLIIRLDMKIELIESKIK